MAYYYVKNGGTKTTGSTTKQTGSFASLGVANYYNRIIDVYTGNTLAAGDIICVASDHTYTNTVLVTYDNSLTGTGTGYAVTTSVDVNNCDQELAGAAESADLGIIFIGMQMQRGMRYTSTAGINFNGNVAGIYQDCHFIFGTAGSKRITIFDEQSLTFINCTIDWSAVGDSSGAYFLGNPELFAMFGGSISTSSTVAPPYLFREDGSSVHAELRGVDISGWDGSAIFMDVNSQVDGVLQGRLHNCKLNAATDFITATNTEFVGNDCVIATNSSSDSDSAEYQYCVIGRGLRAEDETSIYRDASTAFPSGTQTSLKCVTGATNTGGYVFFDMPTRYAELSNTASDTLRIYLQSNTQLYDSDVWAEIIYSDGTNQHEPNFISTRHDNLLDTNGTELTTNTESWSGTAQTYKYHIDLDTSGNPGADCYPTVRVFVAKASATIYFDSELVVL